MAKVSGDTANQAVVTAIFAQLQKAGTLESFLADIKKQAQKTSVLSNSNTKPPLKEAKPEGSPMRVAKLKTENISTEEKKPETTNISPTNS